MTKDTKHDPMNQHKHTQSMSQLLNRVAACRLCEDKLPHTPRPVVQAHPDSRILIIGQAPGRRVHQSGIPWNDPSGDRLRDWLGVDETAFYDPQLFALMPMGLCFPGTGKSGDLPPMKICEPQWHPPLLNAMPNISLTLLIGQYAIQRYSTDNPSSVTAAVQAQTMLPNTLVLPHPSPRNNIWQSKNPWFMNDILPQLKSLTEHALE